jgi:hypothetical protein
MRDLLIYRTLRAKNGENNSQLATILRWFSDLVELKIWDWCVYFSTPPTCHSLKYLIERTCYVTLAY